LLDTFSQHNAFLPKDVKRENEKFSIFINNFSEWTYSNKISLIHIYYYLKEKNKLNGNVKLSKLYDELGKGSLQRISTVKKLGQQFNVYNNMDKDKYGSKYSFIKLLYKFRSKLVHEYRFPSFLNTFDTHNNYQEPYYANIILSKEKHYWCLIFPYQFLRTLVIESLENYLSLCLQEKQEPIKNYKSYYHWYEK
jgi:hypothetical protein